MRRSRSKRFNFKVWLSNQQELREKENILAQRVKIHNEINEEKERLLKEQRLARAAGTMSAEDKQLLENRRQRIEKKADENKQKLANSWNNVVNLAKKIGTYTGNYSDSHTKSRRKKRSRY